nr:TIGR04255 family protein [uncultured Methanospirillum sp.]
MDSPLPHNFSRSPVEEVCFSLTINRDQISLTVPAPYPGWGAIRLKIDTEIAALPDTYEVTRCSLIYRDHFLLHSDGFSQVMSGINQDIFHTTRVSGTESELIPVALNHELRARVYSRFDGGEQPAWTLTFAVETGEPHRFEDPDEILSWFDEAHAVIHTLFDQIVPVEIVETIR